MQVIKIQVAQLSKGSFNAKYSKWRTSDKSYAAVLELQTFTKYLSLIYKTE